MHGFEALNVALVKHIRTLIEEGGDWPVDADYKVSYRLKSWPCGYDEPQHRYFKTFEEVKAWEREYARWAREDGNGVQYTVYKWDLGPEVIKDSFF